jgi:hypothetical protein
MSSQRVTKLWPFAAITAVSDPDCPLESVSTQVSVFEPTGVQATDVTLTPGL